MGNIMKKIKLTHEKYAIVDDEDFEYLNQFKWYALKTKNNFYAIRSVYLEKCRQTSIQMQREIMKTPKGMLTDHIDFNGLNNQKNNLRICSREENGFHQLIRKGRKYKGVCWKKENRCWVAQINFCNKKFHLGYFRDEKEAAEAYNIKAKELFGEFAYLNTIK